MISGAISGAPISSVAISSGDPVTLFYLRPDADVDLDGWTDELNGTTNIFTSIDEISVDDDDYVKSPMRGGITADLKVRLYEGAALIVEWTHSGISDNFVTVTQTLTQTAFDSITDFYNLFIELDDNQGNVYRFSLANPSTGIGAPARVRYRYKHLVVV